MTLVTPRTSFAFGCIVGVAASVLGMALVVGTLIVRAWFWPAAEVERLLRTELPSGVYLLYESEDSTTVGSVTGTLFVPISYLAIARWRPDLTVPPASPEGRSTSMRSGRS
jgi:hypothetical protein